jgi:hypothetical protein
LLHRGWCSFSGEWLATRNKVGRNTLKNGAAADPRALSPKIRSLIFSSLSYSLLDLFRAAKSVTIRSKIRAYDLMHSAWASPMRDKPSRPGRGVAGMIRRFSIVAIECSRCHVPMDWHSMEHVSPSGKDAREGCVNNNLLRDDWMHIFHCEICNRFEAVSSDERSAPSGFEVYIKLRI